MPTDFWLNLYWLMLCGMLMYLLGYGIRAHTGAAQGPAFATVANFYLASSVCGILACVVRITTAFVPALQTAAGSTPGVGVRLHVRRRLRARLRPFVADQDEVVHQGLTPAGELRR